jgi:hypothetical protein
MRPHVSAETMARFRQGDLSQRKASQISTHLAGCGRCSVLNEDLGGVTALLASTDVPPMPEHLAERISGALAAEASRRAAAPGGRAAPGGKVAPAPRRRPGLLRIPSGLALRGLAVAAAAVVVAGGIYEIAVRGASSGPSGTASGASAAARPTSRLPGNGVMEPAPATFGPALEYRHAGRPATITPLSTGTDFTPSALASQVTAEVARYGVGFTTSGPNARPAAVPGEQAETFGSMSVSALRGCVNRIAAGNLVLLVDVAHYRGTLAAVIVTGTAAGRGPAAGPLQIWVVGAGCSAARSDVLAHATAASPS